MAEYDSKHYYNKATGYNSEGKFGLAVDNFLKALSFEPDSLEINFNLGVAYINKKEYENAVNCFKKVLSFSPDEVAGLSNLALAYSRLHKYPESIQNYKRVLELTPEDTSIFKDLGDVYTKNRQYDEAIELYNRFLKAHPTSFVVKESLTTAINLKKNQSPQSAERVPEAKLAEVELGATCNSAEEYFNQALVFIKSEDYDSAIENLRKCLKANSNYPKAFDLLNKLFKMAEQQKNAPKQSANASSMPLLAPSSAPAHEAKKPTESAPQPLAPSFIDYRKFNEFYTLAKAYYQAGNYSSALEYFNKCLEVNPTDISCRNSIEEIKAKM